MVDSWGHSRQYCTLFYFVDHTGPDVVLGMPGLKQLQILIDPSTEQWHFKVNASNLQLDAPTKFTKDIDWKSNVFVIMCCAAAIQGEEEDHQRPEIPQELLEFSDVFSLDMAGTLLALKQRDHAIELEAGKEPPYGPLYNLSQTELSKLRRYLEDSLHKGWIQHSTSSARALILFIPKKDGGLCLCVDYRSLNAVTVKN